MHRVELKACSSMTSFSSKALVPNAPCGVERKKRINSLFLFFPKFLMHRVELKARMASAGRFLVWFLMHRVELKAVACAISSSVCNIVPNAPCGVERASQQAP